MRPAPSRDPTRPSWPREESNSRALAAAVDRAAALLAGATKPILLAGAHLRSYGAIGAFRGVAEALDAWNADDGHGLGLTATTGGELADAISKARKHRGGPVLIECQIAHDDCSPQLIEWGARVARANTRPHQTT